jgi:hypothetical protein
LSESFEPAHRDRRRRRAADPAPITKGSQVRLKQPKLPEGTWDITVCAVLLRVDAEDRRHHQRRGTPGRGARGLTLTLDMRWFLIPVIALFYKGLTNRYMNLEAEGMKRAAETS